MQQRDDRSCEPHVGHNERQKGERQEHGAYKSERLFSVINMEMAEEEKACNCEISVQRALPALLPVLSFFFSFFFFLSIFLALSPLLPPVQQGLLIGSSLMRVNDWRIQASLWTKQIIIVRSKEVQRQSGNFSLLSPLSSMFGEWRKHRKLSAVLKADTHTHLHACSHSHTSVCCRSSQLQSRSSLINELRASVWTSCGVMLP